MMFDDEEAKIDRRGNLIISFPHDPACKLKITPWQDGLNCFALENGQWERLAIMMMPIISGAELPEGSHKQFIKKIPQRVRRAVSGLRHYQFAMMQLAARDDRFMDLIESTPQLAWLFTEAYYMDPDRWTDFFEEGILTQKQTVIMKVLFGWSSKSALKVMRKIRVKKGSDKELNAIRFLFQSDDRVIFVRHMKIIPTHYLSILRTFPELTKHKLLEQFKDPDYEGGIIAAIAEVNRFNDWQRDIERMGRVLELDHLESKIGSVESSNQMREFHDEVTDEYNKLIQQRRSVSLKERFKNFPPPPYGGTDSILPITDIDDLIEEGASMRHCVTSYASLVAEGRCYIYRVISPQRATMEIRLGGQPSISQLKLERNKEPSDECWKHVQSWFDQAVKRELKVA